VLDDANNEQLMPSSEPPAQAYDELIATAGLSQEARRLADDLSHRRQVGVIFEQSKNKAARARVP